MRRNDFQNRELPTNILALLLVTTRRVTPDETRVLRHCDFPDSSRELHTQRHQEQTAMAMAA